MSSERLQKKIYVCAQKQYFYLFIFFTMSSHNITMGYSKVRPLFCCCCLLVCSLVVIKN